MLSFFEVPKGVLKRLTTFGQDFFDRMTVKRKNIGSLNGT
jgi:hypothetical protein